MKRSVRKARQRELEEKIASLKQVDNYDSKMGKEEDAHDEFLASFTSKGAQQVGDRRTSKAASKANSKENVEMTAMFDLVA